MLPSLKNLSEQKGERKKRTKEERNKQSAKKKSQRNVKVVRRRAGFSDIPLSHSAYASRDFINEKGVCMLSGIHNEEKLHDIVS